MGALFGCSSLNQSSVPGTENGVTGLKPVATSEVLTAIKAQLADAFLAIDEQKRQSNEEYVKKVFAFKKGSGTFSGQTDVVATDGGKVSAVIPLTVYPGTTLSPSIGAGISTTSNETTALSFTINPEINKEAIRVPTEILKGKAEGNFIKEQIVKSFEEVIKIPRNGKKPYPPEMEYTGLVISTSFAVVRSVEGDTSSLIIVPAADLNTLAPSLSASEKETLTYSLKLELPFTTGIPDDPRKLIYGRRNSVGGIVLVEEPFDHKRYNKVKADLEQEEDDLNIPVDVQTMRELFQAFGERENGDAPRAVVPEAGDRKRSRPFILEPVGPGPAL